MCNRISYVFAVLALMSSLGHSAFAQRKSEKHDPFPSTQPLTLEGDLAAQMVDGIDKFLLKEWDKTSVERFKFWKELVADEERVKKEFPELRKQLAKMLGAHELRVDPKRNPLWGELLLVSTDKFAVSSFSWRVLRDVHVEGLLLTPLGKKVSPDGIAPLSTAVIVIPDANQTPEELVGLTGSIPAKNQLPRHLAELGHRVIIPYLIDHKMEKRNGRAVLSNREFAYRPAFELGRHLIGYELQKIFGIIDAVHHSKVVRVGVVGYGEGGMLALYAAALDERIMNVAVSGYFESHNKQWNEPLDRNVFGIWQKFGNAELAVLAAPHCRVVIEQCEGPSLTLPGDGGGAPSEIRFTPEGIANEHSDLRSYIDRMCGTLKANPIQSCVVTQVDYWSAEMRTKLGLASSAVSEIMTAAVPDYSKQTRPLVLRDPDPKNWNYDAPLAEQVKTHVAARAQRQLDQIVNDTQRLLTDSPYVRQEFMKKLDTSSLEKYKETVEPYREVFAKEVIGRFEIPLLPPQPKSRQVYDEEKWTGYEVVLDVFPDVYAYGLLLVPKDIKAGEKRPVVVCQHGLEGRPQDVIGDEKRPIYEAFAAKLAERGFITFAPQNLYIGRDRFRTLQRKANPLGKTLFSIIVPQHQQIVNWLGSLPMVDKSRIAFYGLSYGGKSAMRIPPLVPEYSAVICSADFNEWVWKNASTKAPYSYVWTNEYEIFEWDLGSTFNYAEMAALICPRPFMVERGHFDGVSSDEAVAYEYAKVQFLYQAKLKLQGKCEIEFFDGPHKINGKGTFDFLHRHLNWPKKEAEGK